jgi:hemoglobin
MLSTKRIIERTTKSSVGGSRITGMIDDLYDIIGGRPTVAAATESFYRRVLEDETLRHFFETSDMAHLVARQSMFISMLLGGRVVYTGKKIGLAHADARAKGLNDKHFEAFLKHFREALDEVGVKPDKADKVMKLLEGQRNTVLNR